MGVRERISWGSGVGGGLVVSHRYHHAVIVAAMMPTKTRHDASESLSKEEEAIKYTPTRFPASNTRESYLPEETAR